MDGLRDHAGRIRISNQLRKLGDGKFGNAKSVGEGVHELRMDFGPGYRAYFITRGGRLILLLCGGDKSSQKRDMRWPRKWRRAISMGYKTKVFDPAKYLKSEEDVIAYLDAAMEDNDPAHIARALGDVARSEGMTEISRRTGLGRQALYTALSEQGNPTLDTVTSIISSLGLRLSVRKAA
jgi:probable addiction module antidote protein/putative addiction module killer protein